MQVRITPLAEADLIDVAMSIAKDNPERALSFVDELEAQGQQLGQTPLIGALRPELGHAIRVWPYGRYLIFYRPGVDEVIDSPSVAQREGYWRRGFSGLSFCAET